jgi:myosin-crossreactive antigen
MVPNKKIPQASITNFFKHSKKTSDFVPTFFDTPTDSKCHDFGLSQGMKIKPKKRSVSCTNKRKKPVFKLPKEVDDPLLQGDIRDSFKRAFFAKNMKYSTTLVYSETC